MQVLNFLIFVLFAPFAFCAPPPYPIVRSKNSTDTNNGHPKLKIAEEILTTAYKVFENIDAGVKIFDLVMNIREKQQKAEEDYTNGIVSRLRTNHPDQNVLIFHDIRSDASRLNGAAYNHVELDLPWSPGTKGYEVYVFDNGTFAHVGDGGARNWVCDGSFNISDDGLLVTFFQIQL